MAATLNEARGRIEIVTERRRADVASFRAMYSLIVIAKLNDIDPRAWLADVLTRIADYPATRLHEPLPWHWKKNREPVSAPRAA